MASDALAARPRVAATAVDKNTRFIGKFAPSRYPRAQTITRAMNSLQREPISKKKSFRPAFRRYDGG